MKITVHTEKRGADGNIVSSELTAFALPRDIKSVLRRQMDYATKQVSVPPLSDKIIHEQYIWTIEELLERMISDPNDAVSIIFWGSDLGGYQEVSNEALELLKPYETTIRIIEREA